MCPQRYSEEPRPSTSITSAIAEGYPWTARLISDNNLRQHCHLLARTFRGPHPLTDSVRAPCARLLKVVEEKCNLLTAIHPSDFQAIPILVRIAAYAPRWIREPETWTGVESNEPRTIQRSLLTHLFASWQVPAFFENAWLVRGDLQHLERDWYCHFASGGSMRNVQGMPSSVSSRALHLAMSAPAHLTIKQAIRWGQINALGGSPELLAEVLSSRMINDLSNDAHWSRLFEKVVAAKNFNPTRFGLIADTLLEALRKGNEPRAKSLIGLPLKDLLRHCRHFWNSILKAVQTDRLTGSRKNVYCPHLRLELHHLTNARWAHLTRTKPFDKICIIGAEPLRCLIVELTHQWELVAESRLMKHCVDTYGRACRLGSSSIFSVRTEEIISGKRISTSHLTIEVLRQSRRIIQVRGRWNQFVSPQKIPLLRQWAHEMELKF